MTDHPRNMKIGTLRAFPIERIGDNTEQRVKEAKHSGKVILPSFVLRRVCRTDQTLMIFKLINEQLGRYVFCGVFSFDGEEQRVSVPLWILKQLCINSGDKVSIELVTASLQKGLFAKFEPMTKAFLHITDPKAVLEHCLRSYVCITREDIISIYYNRNVYELKVCETLPSDTIVINECDLTVDFQEMKESIELPEECDLDQIQSENNKNSFEAFSGAGQTTAGKRVSSDQNRNNSTENGNEKRTKQKIGVPDYDYKIGSVLFKRYKSDLIKTDVNSNADQKKETNPDTDQKKDNVDSNRQSVPRRPLTRSQTQQMRSDANNSNTSTESRPSDQKRRKKNDEKKNNKQV